MKILRQLFIWIFKWLNDVVFLITELSFSLLSVSFILGGAFGIIGIPLSWYFDQEINFHELWLLSPFSVLIGIGFNWDKVIIKNYPIISERYKNSNIK